MTDRTVRFIIRCIPTPSSQPRWEEFDLRWRPGMNVITGFMDIAENPVDPFGKPTTPVTYDSQLPGRSVRLLCHAHRLSACQTEHCGPLPDPESQEIAIVAPA